MRYSGSTSLRGLQKILEVIHFSWSSWFRIPKSLLLGFLLLFEKCWPGVCFILAQSFEPLSGQTIRARAKSHFPKMDMWNKNDRFLQECHRFAFGIFAQIFARVKMKTLFKRNFGLRDLKAFKPGFGLKSSSVPPVSLGTWWETGLCVCVTWYRRRCHRNTY